MRKSLVVSVCLLLSSGALAEEQASPQKRNPLGIDLSLRLGPAIPGGTNQVAVEPLFPLWLGLGYRIGGVWYVGISGVYAFGHSYPNFTQYNVQFLVEAAYHPLAYARVDPWIGLGIGGEWFHGGFGTTAGWVPIMFEMGVDFALAQSFRLGPFYAFQFVVNGSDTHFWNVVGLQLTGLP